MSTSQATRDAAAHHLAFIMMEVTARITDEDPAYIHSIIVDFIADTHPVDRDLADALVRAAHMVYGDLLIGYHKAEVR